MSHEIAGSNHPLLVSLEVQAKLGLSQKMRKGEVTMDDYGGDFSRVIDMLRCSIVVEDDRAISKLNACNERNDKYHDAINKQRKERLGLDHVSARLPEKHKKVNV